MKPLQIAALQLDLVWHDPDANKERINLLLQNLHKSPDVILLPEMFTTGFTMEADKNYEFMGGKTVKWMGRLAKKYSSLVGGSLIIKEGSDFFNRFLLVSPKGILAEYDKRHLFRMANEDDYYEKGEEWVRIEYKGWKICPQICYDLRFPVWSRNRPLIDGSLSYDLLIYVANWPAKRVGHWETLLQARAIENQCFVAGVNRVGQDGNGIDYTGSSMLISPMGEVLSSNSGEETILEATLEAEKMATYRTRFPAWQDADEFDLYM